MLKVAIDRGNSATKLGMFNHDTLVAVETIMNEDDNKIEIILRDFNPQFIIISSVDKKANFSGLENGTRKVVNLDHKTRLPFNNDYLTPETLGKDRLAAIAGAQELHPGKSVLAIDAGTAITYDLLLNGITYPGGAISPGLEMRFKALNVFTSMLPKISKSEECDFPGQKSAHSIAAGVINGMIFEIEGFIYECEQKWGTEMTILTGGDADFFAGKLKKSIFVSSNLVLIGLNRILNHNV